MPPMPDSRGYFAIGAEGITNPMNLGTLMRTAHAFDARFVFTIAAQYSPRRSKSDTSRTPDAVPLYTYDSAEALVLPRGCRLIGVELLDEAVELPSFRHPTAAAYVLGAERGSLSPGLQARCQHIVRIPTRFCVNLGIAGAIVMYDRQLSLGRFAERAVWSGGRPQARSPHVHGGPLQRRRG